MATTVTLSEADKSLVLQGLHNLHNALGEQLAKLYQERERTKGLPSTEEERIRHLQEMQRNTAKLIERLGL